MEVPLSVHRHSGGHCSYLQRQVRTVQTVQGRRLPCHDAEDVSLGLVQQTTEIPQLQYIDQVFDVLVVQFQQIRAKLWETVEIPQLQLEFSWTSCCSPVVCNNRCLWSSQLSTAVNVPVIMRDSGKPQIQVIANFWWTFQLATETGARHYSGSDDGFFDAFCVIFRAPPVVPELSASFSSFGVLAHNCECSRAPAGLPLHD